MTEKLYLPVSILLSSLILSATLFLVGGTISNQLTGWSIGVDTSAAGAGTGDGAAIAAPPAAGNPAAGNNPPSAAPQVNMSQLIGSGDNVAHLLSGNANSKVKIVEFSDFQCPFCGAVEPTLAGLIKKYGNDVAVYYRHFPLTSIHPSAQKAAEASECAAEQGKFKEYHGVLFKNQQALDLASLKKYAGDIGLDAAKFSQCFDSAKFAGKVNSDASLGSGVGVNGTPAFFINGQQVVGAQPQANFEKVIDPLLN